MEQNPIKYSDLIIPDDAIKNLIAQLQELIKVYGNTTDTIKQKAADVAAEMQKISGATEEGRRSIRAAATETDKLAQMRTRIAEAEGAAALEMARLKRELKEAQQRTKDQERMNNSLEGSYDNLAAKYNLLKQQLNKMTAAERENTDEGKKLVAQAAATYEQMKKLQEATGKHVLNVGNYADATRNLKKELKEMLAEMAQLESAGQRGSERYKQLARSAGQLQDNIADARREMQRYASDTLLLDDAVDVLTTATTAWQVYQGAVNAFGIESEEAQKAMARLQGIISMTNGVQQLAKKFTDNSTATYKIYHKVLRLVGLEKKAETVVTTANTTAKGANTTATATNTAATEANTVAVESEAVAMTGATVAAKALRVALMTIGIGLVVAAVGALVAYWDDIVGFFKAWVNGADEAARFTKEVADATADCAKDYAKARAEMTAYEQRIVSFNGTKEQEKALVDELNQKYGTAMGQYQTLDQWKEQLTKRGDAYCQMILLEAEAQAILNKYMEAYQNLLKVQNTNPKDLEHWWKLSSGEDIKERQVAEAQVAADTWMNAYLSKMKEAESMRSRFNFNAPTITTPTTSTRTTRPARTRTGKVEDPKKAAEEEAKRREQEYKEALRIKRAYEDEQLKLEADEWEKRRKQADYQYGRQIEDLRHQLATEKTLSVESRRNIEGTIEALERQHTEALVAINDEYLKDIEEKRKKQSELYRQYTEKRQETQYQQRTREIQTEIETIDAILAYIAQGTFVATEAEVAALKQRTETLVKEARKLTKEAAREIVRDALDILEAVSIDWSNPMDATKKMTEAFLDLEAAFDGGNLQDKIEAVAQTFGILTSAIEQTAKMQEEQARKAVEAANRQVEAAKSSVQAEIEARNQGYANNVELAQKELEMARKNQQKAAEEQRKAQKAQQAVQTVQQIGNLVSATALIWSQLGFPFAIPAIAVMWGSFAAAKIKAKQATKSEEYRDGTVELLQGGSHQSGHDVDLGMKPDGTRRRAEGGEFFAVINRRNSRRYRDIIPKVIGSLNDGTFIQTFGNAYPRTEVNVHHATDISRLSEDVRAIRQQGDSHEYTENGHRVVKYKNVTRRTRE